MDEIICEEKSLMFKSHDSSSVCVNVDSIEKLKHCGWQTKKPVMACTIEYDAVCGINGMTYGNMYGLKSHHMALNHHGDCTGS